MADHEVHGANASTVAQRSVKISVDPQCTGGDGMDCPKSGASTKGLRLQWSSPDGWRDVAASGLDFPRTTMPVGATRTVLLRVAATARLGAVNGYQVEIGVTLPTQDDGSQTGGGARAQMTVR
jgi:hypothetical protein